MAILPVISVPQGSILDPLIFTIYINDFPEVLKHVTAYLFADDIYPSHTPSDQIAFQEDLNNVCNWSRKWKLFFNCTKCAVLHFWQEGTEQAMYTLNDTIKESKFSINDLSWFDHYQAKHTKPWV